MNKALLHKEVQEYIDENYTRELSKLVFQGSPFELVTMQELATQLTGKRKAEKKLPTWFRTEGIVYPPSLNLEQTSSEVTAEYKASQLGGEQLVDLTGGFGIDSFYFSKHFRKVIHCELNPELSELVAHNSRQLKAYNIETYTGDGIEFLRNFQGKAAWIYVDPSRRDEAGGRVFHLSDCLPDVPEHLELLLEKSENVLVKTSPLLDLQAGLLSLKKVKDIQVVAVNNEVKELLWFLSKTVPETITVKAVNIKKTAVDVYENQFRKEAQIHYSPPLNYLYEPNAALMKSGLYDQLAEELELGKLHPNSQLFTSDILKEYPGRRFQVIEEFPYSRKKLKPILGKLDNAHIATRNFPESVANLRKLFKLKDGGENYLFFTTLENEGKVLLICKKLI